MKYKTALSLLMLVFCYSCALFFPEEELEKVYPQNIDIPGYGSLKYEQTLWDDHSIGSMFLEGDTLWFYTAQSYGGTHTVRSHSIDSGLSESHFTVDVVRAGPIDTEDYVVTMVSISTAGEEKPILRLVDKLDWTILDRTLPVEDPGRLHAKDSVLYLGDYSSDASTEYLLSHDYGINWTEIDSDTYDASRSQTEIRTDSLGNQYRIIDESFGSTKTYLEVSVDGTSWYRSNLGTNYGQDVVFYDDFVYIACNWYFDSYFAWFPGPYTGGGIHVLRWDRE